MIEQLVARWGYVAIVGGTFLEGETILLLAGALAHRGLLSLPGVMLAAFIGSVAGDQVWFLVGRRMGRAALTRRPRWRGRVLLVERWLDRYGTLFVVGFRFIYGVRTVSPILLGASGYPPRRFVLLNIVGAALWATSFAALGWGVGAGFLHGLGRHARWEELGALALALLLGTAILHLRRRRRSAAAKE